MLFLFIKYTSVHSFGFQIWWCKWTINKISQIESGKCVRFVCSIDRMIIRLDHWMINKLANENSFFGSCSSLKFGIRLLSKIGKTHRPHPHVRKWSMSRVNNLSFAMIMNYLISVQALCELGSYWFYLWPK